MGMDGRIEFPGVNPEKLSQEAGSLLSSAGDVAAEKWNELDLAGKADRLVEEAQHHADSVWEQYGPVAEGAADTVSGVAKDGLYIVGRTGLGVGKLVEDATRAPRTWVAYAMGNEERAVEIANSSKIDELAAALTEFFGAEEQLQVVGDIAEQVGEIGAGFGLLLIPGNGGFAISVSVDALGTAGSALHDAAADGELSDSDVSASVAAAGVAAGTAVVTRGAIDKAADAREFAKRQMGGSYREVRKLSGDGFEAHHMPANSASPLETLDGPCINMTTADHRRTASCGSSPEARAYRARQAELINAGKFKEAIDMDIEDIRSKFGDKYDGAIEQMLDYAKGKGLI